QSGGLAQFRQELEEGVNFLRSNGTIKAPSGTTKLEKLFAFKETLDPNDSRLAQVDAAIEKESRSSPLVSINNEAEEKGLTEEKKALAKSRVSRFESILDQADNAITQDEQLAQLENIDISTGFGTEAKGALASAINAFSPGAGDELLNTDVDALQAFKGVSSRLVNSELNKAKGPQTEGDAKRAQSTLASLTNQNAANKFLVQSLRATNARMIEQSEFYQSVLERDGSLKKADSEWLAFKRSTPMLSDSVRDAETGLPMFYRDFKLKTQERNPGVTDEQILTAWRGMQE
uniref:hypothetical protein n=1 Tax=uncultured Paraglaciecola sp. TaxID=1765024 RepID=UPI0026071487